MIIALVETCKANVQRKSPNVRVYTSVLFMTWDLLVLSRRAWNKSHYTLVSLMFIYVHLNGTSQRCETKDCSNRTYHKRQEFVIFVEHFYYQELKRIAFYRNQNITCKKAYLFISLQNFKVKIFLFHGIFYIKSKYVKLCYWRDLWAGKIWITCISLRFEIQIL